jgi:hypothetical protein
VSNPDTFFEWSDECIEPDGTVFDLMYRSCDLIEADVEARPGRGEGAVGYSTCLWPAKSSTFQPFEARNTLPPVVVFS